MADSAAQVQPTVPDIEIGPQPGPQTTFMGTSADLAVYGGAAGSGKSFALALEPLRHCHVPGFSAVAFRRTSTELQGSGSLWEAMREIYPQLGGKGRENRLDFTFPSGARVEARHLQYDHTVHDHKSKQYTLLLFDELSSFTAAQFWYMLSRNRSTCGVKPYVRAGTNADPDCFVAELIDWWIDDQGYAISERSGVVRWFVRDPVSEELVWGDTREELVGRFAGVEPLSFTYVAAKLEDNPILEDKDPTYRARLNALPRIERMRLLDSNWKVRASAGMYFKQHNFRLVNAPTDQVVSAVRAWDKAATEPSPQNKDPDWTRGVLMGRYKDGRRVIMHMASERGSPGKVDRLIENTCMMDGTKVLVAFWKDPGQAGVVDSVHNMKIIADKRARSVFEPTTNNLETYAGPLSSRAETEGIDVVSGPWVKQMIAEFENFGSHRGHDDIVAAAALAEIYLTRMR